jgi:hypothetical protein
MTASRRAPLTIILLAVLCAATAIGASALNKVIQPQPWLRLLILLVPTIPFALLAWLIVRTVRTLDEMQRRIHLEAVTFAFLAGMFATFVIGQLQRAGCAVPDLNWGFVWPVQMLLLAVSYLIVFRRY